MTTIQELLEENPDVHINQYCYGEYLSREYFEETPCDNDLCGGTNGTIFSGTFKEVLQYLLHDEIEWALYDAVEYLGLPNTNRDQFGDLKVIPEHLEETVHMLMEAERMMGADAFFVFEDEEYHVMLSDLDEELVSKILKDILS